MRRSAPPGDDPLAAGDAIAAEILEELDGLDFREAVGEREREQAFGLRYRAVVEVGMVGAEKLPAGLECDEFDPAAIQILGLDGDRAIATCRVVLPVPGRRLPMEAAFGLRLGERGGVAEWGRVVVDPGYRGDGHGVFMGLAAQGWLSMRARGYSKAIGATPKRLLALFEALGFAVAVLGPPQMYWGEERYPILCDGTRTVPSLRRQWPPEGEAPAGAAGRATGPPTQ